MITHNQLPVGTRVYSTISLSPKTALHPVTVRIMYCRCLCCHYIGESSVDMQVCKSCYDNDFGGTRRGQRCHRVGDVRQPFKQILAGSVLARLPVYDPPPVVDWFGLYGSNDEVHHTLGRNPWYKKTDDLSFMRLANRVRNRVG